METSSDNPYKYVIGLEEGEDSFSACAIGAGLECEEVEYGPARELVSGSLEGEKGKRSKGRYSPEEILKAMDEDLAFFLVTTADDEDEDHLDWLKRHPDVAFNHQIAGPAEEEEEDESKEEDVDWF